MTAASYEGGLPASAEQLSSEQPPAVVAGTSVEDQLQQLSALHDAGGMTDEEYTAATDSITSAAVVGGGAYMAGKHNAQRQNFGGEGDGGSASADLTSAVTGLFAGTGAIGAKLGGLSGILDKFKSAGMGDKVTSWVTPGAENQPLSGDEVEKALGLDTIQEMATATGGTASGVKSALAGMIPRLVDQLTPNGSIPGADQIGGLMENIVLGSRGGGGFAK
jgi:uncharacterized protein YidB (DUF937 family)